jgi:predicted nucleic acid-binding protein
MPTRVAEKAFYVLDASVWVSRLVAEDEFHAAVKAWMNKQRAADIQFISPALLLAEVGGAISRRTGVPSLGKRAITRLENLPGLKLVEMDNRLMLVSAHLATDIGLRGADSVYVALAKQLDLPLVTFDADQRQRAQKVVTIQEIN